MAIPKGAKGISRTLLAVPAAALALAACGGGDLSGASTNGASGSPLPKGSEPVHLDPADFSTRIDNPYWPMKPGSRWVYREVNPEDLSVQDVVVTVTNRTKKIANGVEARVVRDVVTEKGVPTEVTSDFYAQDKAGNIWYLGERTTEYANGKPRRPPALSRPGSTARRRGSPCPPNRSPA
jgi:hypothetical protein